MNRFHGSIRAVRCLRCALDGNPRQARIQLGSRSGSGSGFATAPLAELADQEQQQERTQKAYGRT